VKHNQCCSRHLLSLTPAEIGVAMSLGYRRELKQLGVGEERPSICYCIKLYQIHPRTGMTIASSSQQVQPQLSQSRPSPARYSNTRSRFCHFHQKQTCYTLKYYYNSTPTTAQSGAVVKSELAWRVHMSQIQGARGALVARRHL